MQQTRSPDLLMGYNYYNNQNKDSAFYFFNRVVGSSYDSLEKSNAYFYMGLLQLQAGGYYSAQESFLYSIKALDEKDTSHYFNLSSNYNSLGNATLELKDYKSAIQQYRLSYRFSVDGDSKAQILNNIGVAYQRTSDYSKAIAVFDSALHQDFIDTLLQARIISNLARTKWLADSNYVALPEFLVALSLRRLVKNSLGVSTSFGHLADYYMNFRPDSAFFYALKRFEITQRLQNPDDKLAALSQLIKFGPVHLTKQYAEQYLKLNDSLTTVRSMNRQQYQYVLIKLEAEKNKADNLLLQEDNFKQRLIVWITVLLAVLFISAVVIFFLIRRRRLKQESENAIRESRLKTSQKIHDVVANGLYRIMNDLEHRESIDKEPLLDKIDDLYEKSRDISYEDIVVSQDDYCEKIQELVTSFSSDTTKVITVGNEQAFWKAVNGVQKHELNLVLQELMINMQKHSRATKVTIRFRQEKGFGHIEYRDNGMGFKPEPGFGNGLNNTVSRINSINGQITFEKNGDAGLSILISFPLSSTTHD